MKRPTVKDVATHAGVSPATVSLVMRDSPQIPEITKARVRSAMEAVGYVYNRRAAEMRGLSSKVIGLVVANVRNPYIAELTMAIEDAATKVGYTVLLGCSSDDVSRQTQVLRAMVEHQVDGILLLPASHTTPDVLDDLLGRSLTPHILISRDIQDYKGTYVGPDNEASGRLVGVHLRQLGASTIVFLGGVDHSLPREDRLRGLLGGLGPGMPQLAADLPSSSDSTEDVEELLAHVLSVGVPDAIVTYNDMYAFSLMGALRNVGIEPGRDVAVVSFDDVPDAARSYPSLTSASGFPEIVGSRATDLVVEAVRAGGLPPARRLLVRPELSARRSTLAWGEARAAKASTTRTEDNLLPRRA